MNRNTSEHMSGLPGIDRPNHEYRPDMVLEADEGAFNLILDQCDEAMNFIDEGNIPQWCDKDGYCFFCGPKFPKKELP
jgi:hypothetical protein